MELDPTQVQPTETSLAQGTADEAVSFRPDPEPSETDAGQTPSGLAGDQGASGIAGVAATPPAVAAQGNAYTGIREAARAYGVDLSQYQDDRQALLGLLQAQQASRQNDFYTQLGRQVAPHHDAVRQVLAQRQSPQGQATGPKPWERPEFDERWLQAVDKTEDGRFVAKPGVNPMIAEKVQAFADWTTKFQRDPLSVISPYIEDQLQSRVAQQVQQIVQQQFGQVAEQSTISNIMQNHSSWLYLRDQQGNAVIDPMTRKPQASPAGVRYVQYLQEAAQMGVRGSQQQDTYATRLLRADIAQAQYTQGNPNTPPTQQRAASNRPNVNPGQALVEPTRRNVVPGASDPQPSGKSLSQLLRENLDAEGVTDNDFALVS